METRINLNDGLTSQLFLRCAMPSFGLYTMRAPGPVRKMSQFVQESAPPRKINSFRKVLHHATTKATAFWCLSEASSHDKQAGSTKNAVWLSFLFRLAGKTTAAQSDGPVRPLVKSGPRSKLLCSHLQKPFSFWGWGFSISNTAGNIIRLPFQSQPTQHARQG